MAEYALLLEDDVLRAAQATDERYHLARCIAQGFNGGAQLVWDEGEAVRRDLIARFSGQKPPTRSTEDWLEVVARIHRKMQQSGLMKTHSGAVN